MKGRTVICLANESPFDKDLVVGKEYTVLNNGKTHYHIFNEQKQDVYYCKERFKLKNMTKQEAKQAMIDGKKVRHSYYTDDEYIFLNSNGKIQSEDGVVHGGFNGEFWTVYQKFEDGWSIVE